MNVIPSGAATLLAGAATFSLLRFRTQDRVTDACLNQLSKSAQEALDAVCNGSNPQGPELSVAWRDLYIIFRNSRQMVMVTNRARLGHSSDEELPVLLTMLQADHAKLRGLLILVAMESIVGKLGLGSVTHYTREVLWTYGGELELLDLISQIFATERTALRAIL